MKLTLAQERFFLSPNTACRGNDCVLNALLRKGAVRLIAIHGPWVQWKITTFGAELFTGIARARFQ